MVTYPIPLLMIGSFLLLTLMIGLYGSHKATTFRTYAVGNKRFATPILLATLLATIYGGGALMGYIPQTHQKPLQYVAVYPLLCSINHWIVSLLAVRMGPFMKHLSLAETIGNVYGKYPRIITALLSISCSIGIIAAQINIMATAISMSIDSMDHHIITMLATLILIIYATFGGIRGVTNTDVLQFITFTIIIILLAKFMFARTGKSVLEMISFLSKQEKFQWSSLFHFDGELFHVMHCVVICFLPMHTPPVMQRLYMASGPIQIKKVFCYVFFYSLLMQLALAAIGLFVFVIDPALSITEVWGYIIAHIPPAFKGCITICLLGMTMSTADSSLHFCSVMVSHDMVESIRSVKVIPDSYKIRLAKLTALVAGLLAMIIAMGYNSIITLAISNLYDQFDLFFGTVAPPFILAVFGFRGSSRTALIGMATAILTKLVWAKWVKPTIEIDYHVLPFVVANGLAMMAAHYLLPQPAGKGWIRLDDQQKRMQQLIQAFKKYKKTLDLE